MKRKKGGVVSPTQKYWAQILEQCNIPVWVAHGYEEAMEVIAKYEPLGKLKIPTIEKPLRKAPKSRKNPEDIF